MNLSGKKITVHDMCLRDGMHPKQHQITVEQMVTIAKAMDEAGIPLIEVTHGDGLGGASVNYGFPAASDQEYSTAVCREMKKTKVSALLLPGIGTVDHLKMAVDCGISTIRVATHCTEADVSEQHLTMAAKYKGLDTASTRKRSPGCGSCLTGARRSATARGWPVHSRRRCFPTPSTC